MFVIKLWKIKSVLKNMTAAAEVFHACFQRGDGIKVTFYILLKHVSF